MTQVLSNGIGVSATIDNAVVCVLRSITDSVTATPVLTSEVIAARQLLFNGAVITVDHTVFGVLGTVADHVAAAGVAPT